MPDEQRDTCIAKVGEPFRMRECGLPVEYVTAGDPIYQGTAQATYTGFYHLFEAAGHHAVSRKWTA
jgi:hypothetical protein